MNTDQADNRVIKLEPLEEKTPPKKGKSEKQAKHLEKARKTRTKKLTQKKILKKVEEKLMKSDVVDEEQFVQMITDMFVGQDNQLPTPAHKQSVLDMKKDDIVSPRAEYRMTRDEPTYASSINDVILHATPNPSRGFVSVEDPLGYDVIL